MSAGLTASSSLLSGVATYESGQTKSRLYTANAGVAGVQAQSEAEAGSQNEEMIRMKGAQVTGQQVAQTGANNLQQSGTPAQVIASSAGINELDALTTRNNALRKAWGFRVQQQSDQSQAAFAKTAGDFNALGSMLSGGSKAYTEDHNADSWL